MAEVKVSLEDRLLTLSNLDKVFYPSTGFTKGQVIDYYTRMAPFILPHLKGRPLTLKRYPNGVNGEFFYEKQCPSHRPSWLRIVPITGEHGRRTVEYCVIDDLPSLVWAVNLADLEMHTSLSYADSIEQPTAMVFDLDPGEGTGLIEAAEIAVILKRVLADLNLTSVAKTSGMKGIQVYVPLNSETTYDQTKSFSHLVAGKIENWWPDKVTSNMKKTARKGKIFIDWSQNDQHKTTVSVYSLRAAERPYVSMPVSIEELEKAISLRDVAMLRFDSQAVIQRTTNSGDMFSAILELNQELPDLV